MTDPFYKYNPPGATKTAVMCTHRSINTLVSLWHLCQGQAQNKVFAKHGQMKRLALMAIEMHCGGWKLKVVFIYKVLDWNKLMSWSRFNLSNHIGCHLWCWCKAGWKMMYMHRVNVNHCLMVPSGFWKF